MTRRQSFGLLMLSLLASATWFIGDLLPVQGSPLAGEGLRLLLCCVLTLAARPRAALGGASLPYTRAALVSLGLIAVPSLLINAARGRIAATDGVLIFALTPVVAMLIVSWRRTEQNGLGTLPPALLGAAGVMILLPVRLPDGGAGVFGACLLLAAMLSAAASMVWLHLLLQDLAFDAAVPMICLLNGLVLSASSVLAGLPPWDVATLLPHGLRAVLFDLPQVALLVWLTKAISPQRLAGRYLIAPLMTVVEGLVLIRPHSDFRTWAGLAVLVAGIAMMLFGRQIDASDDLRLKL